MPVTLASTALSLDSQALDWDDQLSGTNVTLTWHVGATLHSVTVAAAVQMSGSVPTPTDGGVLNVQTIRVDVRKSLLAARPQGGVVVTCGGFVFDHASSVSGDNPGDLTWTIRAQRIV